MMLHNDELINTTENMLNTKRHYAMCSSQGCVMENTAPVVWKI